MTKIREDLRALIAGARRDPLHWGKPGGLSQETVASRAGYSAIWLRQIESGRAETASPELLGAICYALDIDSVLLRALGYGDVALAVDVCVMLRENEISDELINASGERCRVPPINARERKFLLKTLRAFREQEAQPA